MKLTLFLGNVLAIYRRRHAAGTPGKLGYVLGRRLRTAAIVAAAAAIVTTLLFLPVQTAVIGDGWSDAFDLPTIRDVLFATSVGQAWQLQTAAALLLGVVFVLGAGAIAVTSGLRVASLGSDRTRAHARWLAWCRASASEIAIAVGVLGLVSVFGMLEPA